MIPYSTEIAVKALGVTVVQGALTAKENSFCACCGRPVNKDEKYHALNVSDAFMDDAFFAIKSNIQCNYCSAFMSSSVSGKVGNMNCYVFTEEGAYPISTDDNRTWFLLTPPEPPFTVMVSNTKNFMHILWKTPVTLSHEMMFIGWPHKIMTIRHKTLLKAVEVCKEISNLYMETKTTGVSDSKKKLINPITHPYISLNRKLDELKHGLFRPDIIDMAAKNKDIAGGIKFLQKLTEGETWALSTLSKANLNIPLKPDKFTLPADALTRKK